MGFRLQGVNQVGELDGVLDEENGNICATKVATIRPVLLKARENATQCCRPYPTPLTMKKAREDVRREWEEENHEKKGNRAPSSV